MYRRFNEIGAINILKRMGYVANGDRPKMPGPPEPPMYVITDAGRQALIEHKDGHRGGEA
jgi:hypothetical protein